MKIAVRASASHAIGLGHVARVTSLVEELRARGHDPVVMFDGDASLASWARARNLVLAPVAPLDDFDLAIVDGPHLVDTRARRVVVIDDRGLDGSVDVVVNHNVHAATLSYPRAGRCLLGRAYTMLRREVLRLGRGACTPAAKLRRIVVTFGGSDPVQATAAILRALPRTRVLDVDVILGPGHRGELPTTGSPHRITIYRAPDDPAALFARADAAIASAGGTLGELAFLGCPTLAFAIVDDQLAPARESRRLEAIAGGHAWDTLSPAELDGALRQFLDDDVDRIRLRSTALALVDGKGARRIISALT